MFPQELWQRSRAGTPSSSSYGLRVAPWLTSGNAQLSLGRALPADKLLWSYSDGSSPEQLSERKRLQFAFIIEVASQPPSAEPSSLAGIIHHGELAPTDCNDGPYADPVSRLEEAHGGGRSARRSHHRQEGLRLLPEAP